MWGSTKTTTIHRLTCISSNALGENRQIVKFAQMNALEFAQTLTVKHHVFFFMTALSTFALYLFTFAQLTIFSFPLVIQQLEGALSKVDSECFSLFARAVV